MSQQSIAALKAASQGPLTAEKQEAFQDALAEIETTNIALLSDLYTCFVDGAALLPLMWQLLHLLEDFDEEASLLALVEKTPYLEEHAPDWLRLMWQRTLNAPEVFARLKYEILPLLSDVSVIREYLLAEPTLEVQARELF